MLWHFYFASKVLARDPEPGCRTGLNGRESHTDEVPPFLAARDLRMRADLSRQKAVSPADSDEHLQRRFSDAETPPGIPFPLNGSSRRSAVQQTPCSRGNRGESAVVHALVQKKWTAGARRILWKDRRILHGDAAGSAIRRETDFPRTARTAPFASKRPDALQTQSRKQKKTMWLSFRRGSGISPFGVFCRREHARRGCAMKPTSPCLKAEPKDAAVSSPDACTGS